MTSIRQRLLLSLLLGLVLITSTTGVVIYRHVHAELDELYNAHLQQIASFIAREWAHMDTTTLAAVSLSSRAKSVWEEEDYLIQLWRNDGVLLGQEIPAVTKASIPLFPTTGFLRQHINGESWRIYRANSSNFIVQIAQPEYARRSTIRDTSVQLIAPLILQIPLLILVAWIAVRIGLRPLESLSSAIAQRRPNALQIIDSADQPKELQPLVDTLNALLKRLDAALQQQRNFVADAAHELRTPIATLQLQLDLLGRAHNPHENEQAVIRMKLGLQRLTHLAQQLLSIARAESHPNASARELFSLPSIVEAALERHLPMARASDIDLGVTRLEPISIFCTRSDIESIFDNLLSNAIRYTPNGGRIDLAVYCDGGYGILQITDNGVGIPVAERTRIFDRFYRILDSNSVSHATEGSGLGLAIVKTICDRNSAIIEINDGDNARGTCFTVRWPLKE